MPMLTDKLSIQTGKLPAPTICHRSGANECVTTTDDNGEPCTGVVTNVRELPTQATEMPSPTQTPSDMADKAVCHTSADTASVTTTALFNSMTHEFEEDEPSEVDALDFDSKITLYCIGDVDKPDAIMIEDILTADVPLEETPLDIEITNHQFTEDGNQFIRESEYERHNTGVIEDMIVEIPAEGISHTIGLMKEDIEIPEKLSMATEYDAPVAKEAKTTGQQVEVQAWQACKESCKRKCPTKITDDQRTKIVLEYRELNHNEKRQMIFQHVTRIPKGRSTAGEHDARRDMTFIYKLKNADGIDQHVCKPFFLKTLGYNEKNDRLVTTVIKSTAPTDLSAKRDMRGQHPSSRTIDRAPIRDHVNSFNPTISQYRREHAPNRRYLPSDITIGFMQSDFNVEHPDQKCGIETYRKAVSVMKINFTKLGEEECEKCIKHEEHLKISHTVLDDTNEPVNVDQDQVNCPECDTWKIHKNNSIISRANYQEDSSKDWSADYVVKSADLQKVIMLPRMPGNKTSIFTKRIIAFHETFATVGEKCKEKKKENSTSIVWHEGTAGRKAEEISSAFVTALERYRDKRHAILWLDNCSAQNKKWCLLTTLVSLVNGESVEFEDVTLNFFETGHMSANSFHHGVELEMKHRKGGNVCDFSEFVDVVRQSNAGKVDVIVMENESVRAYKGGQSQAKLKRAKVNLSSMCAIEMRRGSRKLHYKASHNDIDFQELDFLKNGFPLTIPAKLRTQGRGIHASKKADIVAKLCPMIPITRRQFWESVLVDDTVGDALDSD